MRMPIFMSEVMKPIGRCWYFGGSVWSVAHLLLNQYHCFNFLISSSEFFTHWRMMTYFHCSLERYFCHFTWHSSFDLAFAVTSTVVSFTNLKCLIYRSHFSLLDCIASVVSFHISCCKVAPVHYCTISLLCGICSSRGFHFFRTPELAAWRG